MVLMSSLFLLCEIKYNGKLVYFGIADVLVNRTFIYYLELFHLNREATLSLHEHLW
jgi:hypothetical protein